MTSSATPIEETRIWAATALEDAAVFAALPASARAELVAGATIEDVAEGEWLFRAGDPADSLYIVDTGALEVVGTVDGEQRVLRTCSRGSVVGELAALAETPRSASVRARRDATVVRVGARALRGSLAEHPEFARGVVRALAAQLQASAPRHVSRSERAHVIAVLAVGRVPGSRLAQALAKQLRRFGSVEEIDQSTAPAYELELSRHVAQLVARAERASDTVILQAGVWSGGEDEWADACIREADRVVLLVGPDADSGACRIRHDAVELVLVGPAPDLERLNGLLDAARPKDHWFLPDPKQPSELGPVTRSLAGRSIALVLSGGGARGFAHVGLLEELDAAGIVVDRYAGTSMGAYVGALAAFGLQPGVMRERLYADFVTHNPLGDPTVPIIALSRGQRGRDMVEKAFGETDIAQLRVPYFCVTVDITTGDELVHDRGPMALCVGASMAIPGYLPPVPLGERRLIDGGMLNNFPVDHMLKRADGPVIGCDVYAGFKPTARDVTAPWLPWAPARVLSLAGRLPSFGMGAALGTVRRALTSWDEPVPTLPEVLSRIVTLPGRLSTEAHGGLADLLVAPELTDIGVFAFDRIDDAIERGRFAARAALESDGAALLTGG